MSHPSPSATYSAMLTRAVSQCSLHCDQCAFRQAQRRRPRSLFVTYVSQVAHDTRGVCAGRQLRKADGTKNPRPVCRVVRLRLVLAAEKDRKTEKHKHYVKTDRSTGRAQSDAITRARSAASASDDSSEA